MTAQGIAIRITARDWWTSNHRLSRFDEARRTKAVRMTAGWLAKLHLEPMTACNVTATIHTPTNRRFDAPNAYPMVKAAVDGIVDAGVLPDDDDTVIECMSFRRGPKTGEKDIYVLDIELAEVLP